MGRIAIVTDSTAGLPQEIIERYHITVIPLPVFFGKEMYLDNVDMTPDEFYHRLAKMNGDLPTTAQLSPTIFRETFEALLPEADAIITLCVSSGLSGTFDSALQAKEMLPDAPIYVIDSRFTVLAQGLLAVEAARAAEAGATAEEIVGHVQRIIPTIRLYFAVDTLEYLRRGGRIGGGVALLGTALGIKPVLELRDGRIEAAGMARSSKRALETVVQMLVKQVGEGATVRAGVFHATCPDRAAELADKLRQHFNCVEVLTGAFSPVIGTHTGPGTTGATLYPVE